MQNDWRTSVGINLLDYEAFVYRIWNIHTGRAYIGCKSVYGRRGKKRIVSNYLDYWGSCEELSDDIAIYGRDNYRREVLHVCKSRHEALYLECKEQFARDVLKALLPSGLRAYYNSNVMRTFFTPKGEFQARVRAYKLSPLACKCGKPISFQRRHTMHCSQRCSKPLVIKTDVKSRAKAKAIKVPAGKNSRSDTSKD